MFNTTHSGANMPHTILRLPAVKAHSGYSRSTIYLRITQGLWPRPVSLGARAVGWPASEVAALNAARISGQSDTDIRKLVTSLEARRRVSAEAGSAH
jgi:prophage regulatory protein